MRATEFELSLCMVTAGPLHLPWCRAGSKRGSPKEAASLVGPQHCCVVMPHALRQATTCG